jgi:hypothetical protein
MAFVFSKRNRRFKGRVGVRLEDIQNARDGTELEGEGSQVKNKVSILEY